jgi:hypothetical protein
MAARRILTVTTPAGSTDLVTLADVKTELGISGTADDAWLNLTITRASSAAALYCGRVFVVQTYSEQIFPAREHYPEQVPDCLDVLQLSAWPIVGTVTVTPNGASALVQGTDFLVVTDLGQLLRRFDDGNLRKWDSEPVTVAYQAGYATIPADLQDAVIDLIKGRWYARSRDPGLRQESVDGVWSGTYWFGTGPGGPADMPDYVAAKLDRYRVPVVA